MKVTLEELRSLRVTLANHRIQHETLVTQMQILRQHCQELRSQLVSASQVRRYSDEARVANKVLD